MWSRSKLPKEIEPRKEFFVENGARLLEELIFSCDGRCNPIRNYTSQELSEATNGFSHNHIIHKKEVYSLYKGLFDGYFITIKKFAGKEKKYTNICINEVVMSSQMNHKNVLKLLGSCLETEVPMLVYEFTAKGDLFDSIFGDTTLSWERRLRVAADVASAVSYIHTAHSNPIIHRDIKSSNISLDENYVGKLSGFSFSISIPLGETHVEDGVLGTVGFIAPEYIASGKCTEKADVFSFGMLLLEILTRKTPWELARLAEDLNVFLIDYFRSFIESDRLTEIVDSAIWGDGEVKRQQLQAFAELSIRCTEEMPSARPTMVAVTKELRRIERLGSP